MPNEINSKLESKIKRKLISKKKYNPKDGFKNGKVINEVLDKSTVMTLYKMINSHIISYVNGVVSAGKESLVFWAVGKDGKDIALKIYLTSTTSFKKRAQYIVGDPRFSKFRKSTRSMVYLWAKKEYRNLLQSYQQSLPVPKPLHVSNNVLAMDFIGSGGVPADKLLDSEVDENDYDACLLILRDLYCKAEIVHGDFSEYNVFKIKNNNGDNSLMLFDLGSAVDIRHPNAESFLKRDINNITRFFSKRGVSVGVQSDIYDWVVAK